MSLARLSRAAILGALALLLVAVAGAGGALVRVNGIVLHADGGFQPQSLPRHRFVPIDFQGYFEIAAQDGGQPVALEQAVIDFDRDGRLSTGGLPICAPEQVANASPAEARQTCAGAIVGRGGLGVSIGFLGGSFPVSSPLTLFNGPPVDGQPTVVLHAQIAALVTQTVAIVVPIERRRGPFHYRATLDFPPIAGGFGAITKVKVKVGRRFVAAGRKRSYVSAHCADGVLQTHGRFTFVDGTIVDGVVERACTPR